MTRVRSSSVQEMIYAQMADQGWPLQSICGLPKCCVRDQLVTPFYICSSVASRGRDVFHADGAVGIVHQQFERLWAKRPDRDPVEPGFGLIVLAANINELRGYQTLDASSSLSEQVSLLCSAISQVLKGMPQDEQQLLAEFSDGKLFGLPVQFLSMPRYQTKCSAFKEFVDALEVAGADISAPAVASTSELVDEERRVSIRVLHDGEHCLINQQKIPCERIGEYLRDTLGVPWGTPLSISVDGTDGSEKRGRSVREALARAGYRKTVSLGFLSEPPGRSFPSHED